MVCLSFTQSPVRKALLKTSLSDTEIGRLSDVSLLIATSLVRRLRKTQRTSDRSSDWIALSSQAFTFSLFDCLLFDQLSCPPDDAENQKFMSVRMCFKTESHSRSTA